MIRSRSRRELYRSARLSCPSDAHQLRLRFRTQFRRNSADESGVQSEPTKHCANFPKRNRGFIVELQIHQVVVAIDFVAQPRDRLELVIELQDFVQVANASSVYLELDHGRRAV